MTVPSVAIGALAIPVFSIGVADASVVILLANIFGIVPVAFFSTLGPRSGLRQIVLSRFFFGYYAVKLGRLPTVLQHHPFPSGSIIR